MLELIIVFVIVATVAVMVGRSFHRTLTGKNKGCGSNCPNCSCTDFAGTYPARDARK